jgi:hypothetical protein
MVREEASSRFLSKPLSKLLPYLRYNQQLQQLQQLLIFMRIILKTAIN